MTVLAATTGSAMLNPVHAATYDNIFTEAELVAAVNAANADVDTTSTIILTGNFSIAGNSLPAVTKNLTIDVGANTLTSAGATTSTSAPAPH